ncbi:MAG: acyltransferase family protein [Clostridiaceae bacterium]|nr:acyltransferase family protein [Clostridiaceae bacterium]
MGTKKERFLYIDNLRLLMIIFVVIMHLAVTYSGFGSWYFKEGRPIGALSMILFGFYQSFTQGYFMGLLFLLSGFFIPGAYDKKGFGKFIKNRGIRLGIPTLIYMLVINPFILYVQLDLNWIRPKPGFISFYVDYTSKFKFLDGSGPLWFAFALLIFSVAYGLVRYVTNSVPNISTKELNFSFKNMILLILLIAICAFLIRLVQPIGTSTWNMQLCYFSQYVILFIVGIFAYRKNLFSRIDYKFGNRCLFCGLLLGFITWLPIMALGGTNQAFNGGLSLVAAAYAIWESFVAVAMSVGLITLFREKYNHQSKLVKVLSDNSFAVYVFHAPIIIAASQLIKTVTLPPIIKFLILCITCLPICFIFTHIVIKRIPLLKKVM